MDEFEGPLVQVADGVYEVVAPRQRQFCPDCGHIHFVGGDETLHPLPGQPCGSFECCIN